MWDVNISVLVDSGDPADLIRWLNHPRISGVTTNPTLLRKTGYAADEILAKVAPYLAGRPISIYPVESSPAGFLRTAEHLKSIYPNVFIKVPVLDRGGAPNAALLDRVAAGGHNINVTAVHTAAQAVFAEAATRSAPARVVSVFAGRLADSGREPTAEVAGICRALTGHPDFQVVWASSRQVFDLELARRAGCDLITVPVGILERAEVWGKDTATLTRLAVRQFEDAVGAPSPVRP